MTLPFGQINPGWQLLDQSESCKHQSNVGNLLRVKNNDSKTTSLTYFTHCCGVSTVDFEHLNIGWDATCH